MKKKWVSLLLTLVLSAAAVLPASAAVNKAVPAIGSRSVNLPAGGSTQLKVTLQGTNVTYGMLWNTNCPAVAAVSHGTVKAVGPGVASVTATTGDGRSVSCRPQSRRLLPQLCTR